MPEKVIKIPVIADELCVTAATTIPVKNNKNGFSTLPKTLKNERRLSVSILPDRAVKPDIVSPKPTKSSPTVLTLFLPIKQQTTPTAIDIAPTATRYSPPRPKIAMNCAVTVVPTFAPIMTGADCKKVIAFDSASPTVTMVTAALLCVSAATDAPARKPPKGLLTHPATNFLSLYPTSFSVPSPNNFNPYTKVATPPSTDTIAENISI